MVVHRVVDRFGSDTSCCWARSWLQRAGRWSGSTRGCGSPPKAAPSRSLRRRLRRHERGIPQHEPSGGGRSLPYARRGAARARPADPADPAAVTSQGDGEFRRTRVLRDRAELGAMWAGLAVEALDRVDPGLRVYPSPAAEHASR